MMAIRAPALVFLASATLVPALALAQSTAAPEAPPTATAPATGTAPPPAPPASTAPARPATGYGYGTPKKPTATGPVRHYVRRNAIPDAVMPGFHMLDDGSSRFYVRLTKQVAVEEKKAAGVITYVIKGTEVPVWNDRNALVTIHFNTPAYRARLVPHGANLHFVIDLRAEATPVFKVTPAKDGGALLTIDFPKGEYLPSAHPEP